MTLNYHGAGVAVFTRDAQGQTHVLLGKRLFPNFAGTWSFPGGGYDFDAKCTVRLGPLKWKRYTETAFACAFRELFEEVTFWPGVEKAYTEAEIGEPYRLRLPGWHWDTFPLWVHNPELRLPQVNSSHQQEFFPLAWCPVGALPAPLHPGVKGAVRRLRPAAAPLG